MIMENIIIHKAAVALSGKLNLYIGRDGLELKKMTLGMEVAIINISKLVAIYVLAALLGVVGPTAVIHIAYFAIKRYSFGLHALNSTVCTVVSCCLFVAVPLAVQVMGLGIGNVTVGAVFAVVLACLYCYAPADTKARPLIGAQLRVQLKKKAVLCGAVLMLVALLIPSGEVKLLLTLGVVFQTVSVLPITYKILKRSERNYETYENARGQAREH